MKALAKTLRLSALQMALNCGKNGSHLGAGLSSVEIFAALYGGVLKYDLQNKEDENRDRLVVSTTKPEPIKAEFGSVCTVTENGSLLIQLPKPDDKQATMKRLVENYDIDGIKVFEPSLNDIFVEYAGKQV